MTFVHVIAQLAALRFVDSLFEGACIAVFAALVLRFARRQSSTIRFAICFTALIAIAVLPFFRMSHASSGAGHAAIALPESFAVYFFAAWAGIASVGLLRLGSAVYRLHCIRRNCVPVNLQSLDPLLQDAVAAQKIHRRFTLCTSACVRVPTAIGLFKPAIVMPPWVMQELSSAELNQILLHELAHLRRYDDWTNLAQHLVKTLFFFHPAVWWIEKRIALEREMACDDAVLAATSSPRAYAECLARLAEKSFVRQSLALAQAALGKIRHTSLRVAQILNVERPARAGHSWKPAASLVGAFAIACGVAISHAPNLVAFRNSQPAEVANAAVPAYITAAPAMNLAHAASFKEASHSVRATPARLRVRSRQESQSHLAKLSAPSPTPVAPAVHLTNSNADAMPLTETLFFVVQDTTGTSGQQVYRIQLWRVIVFHPHDSAVHAPAKQT